MSDENGRNVLQDGTVILDVVFRCPGQVRRERQARVETKANQDWLSTNKRIFDSRTFRECQVIQAKTAEWLRKRSLPCGLEGYFVLPLGLLPDAYAHLDDADARLAAKVEQFCGEYEQLKERAKAELKELYREEQYPDVERFRRGIRMDRRLIELGVPDPIKVGDAIARAEMAKARDRWQDAAEQVTACLREEFRDMVAHLAERLAPNADGSKKRLHESAVEKVAEFIELFRRRNVLDDRGMDLLVSRAKALLAGKSVELLRDNELIRSRTASAMAEVKVALDRLVTDAPGRRIVFDE